MCQNSSVANQLKFQVMITTTTDKFKQLVLRLQNREQNNMNDIDIGQDVILTPLKLIAYIEISSTIYN